MRRYAGKQQGGHGDKPAAASDGVNKSTAECCGYANGVCSQTEIQHVAYHSLKIIHAASTMSAKPTRWFQRKGSCSQKAEKPMKTVREMTS